MISSERISDIVRDAARRAPDAEAVAVGTERWSYRTLEQRIDKLARALIAAGIGHGDRVVCLSTPHPDFLVTLMAAASIGVIWVGLNPRYRMGEMGYVLVDAAPKAIFARTHIEGRDHGDELAALVANCPAIEVAIVLNGDPLFAGACAYDAFLQKAAAISDAALDQARSKVGGRDPCMIVYTSGSTGQPKGALLHHQGVCDFSRAQNALWPVSGQRLLNYFPINHIGCVIDLTCPTLAGGGTVIFMEKFHAAEAMRLMAEERCSVWGSVPSVMQMQIDLPDFTQHDLSALRLILWEGAAMPGDLLDRLLTLGLPMATNYGMTEATSAILAMPPTRDREVLANSVGAEFPGVEVRLVKADGTEAATGEEGEIWARSCYNMLGYWRRPDATAEALTADGWLRTGDVALRRPDGRYRIAGRIKEMYKSGGYNVYPREVETVLEQHPSVSLAAVVSIADPLWGESGVAYVIAEPGLDPTALEDHARRNLANYKIPKRFVLGDALPLLPVGKVDKLTLTAMAREAFEQR